MNFVQTEHIRVAITQNKKPVVTSPPRPPYCSFAGFMHFVYKVQGRLSVPGLFGPMSCLWESLCVGRTCGLFAVWHYKCVVTVPCLFLAGPLCCPDFAPVSPNDPTQERQVFVSVAVVTSSICEGQAVTVPRQGRER